jgi:hypothetical protein
VPKAISYFIFIILIGCTSQPSNNHEGASSNPSNNDLLQSSQKITVENILTEHALGQVKLGIKRPDEVVFVKDRTTFKKALGMQNAFILRLAVDTTDVTGNFYRDYINLLYKFNGGDSLKIGNYALLDLYR